MKIFSITIENYRQFIGKNEVRFSTDPKRNFTILQGDNGSGKTNFMNAFMWCFYGDEMFRSNYNEGRDIVNESAMQNLEIGQTLDVAVTTVIGEEKPRYEFRRRIRYKKYADGHVSDPVVFVCREITEDRGWVNVNYPELIIEREFIPKSLRSFFFFDGEKMDDYFEDTVNVRKRVERLAQIDILENAIGTIKTVMSSYNSEIGKIMPDLEADLGELDESKEALREAEEEKAELKSQNATISERIGEIDEFLTNNSWKLVRERQNSRNNLNAQKNNLLSKRDENEVDIRTFVSDRVAILLSLRSLVSSDKLIEENTQKGVLPPNIKDVFLKDLLASGSCICGRDLEDGTEHRKKVEDLLQSIVPANIASDAVSGRYALKNMIERKDFLNGYKELIEKRKEIRDDLQEIEEKIEAISLELSESNQEEIRIMEEERRSLNSELNKNNIRYGGLGRKSFELRNKINDLEKAEKIANVSHKNVTRIKNHRDYLGKIRDHLIKIKEEIVEDVRIQLEEKTREYFFNMIWKEDAFSDVRILDMGKAYKISVKSEHGQECLGDISAGERQVLALSFTAALYSISGYAVPVIIDTPLGRISGAPRDNIARSLPDYLSDTQVVMLMTDTEYTKSVRDGLSPSVGKEYLIKYNEASKTSKVIDYGG